jgi:hypothetical protein
MLFTNNSVDSIMSTFRKAIEQLTDLENNNRGKADELLTSMEAIEARRIDLIKEADRASSINNNLSKLVNNV